MKRNVKIFSIILILVITLVALPLKVYASDVTPQIPIEGEEPTPTPTPNPVVTGDETENTVAEDKIAEDKTLPDAGFDKNMIYIISALIIFAVFAYIKVVKYNVD